MPLRQDQIMELCWFAYTADKEARRDLVRGYLRNEDDYTPNFTGTLRRIINSNSKTGLTAISYMLGTSVERATGCDATIIFTRKEKSKVTIFEAKSPGLNAGKPQWDWRQASSRHSHFSDQLIRQAQFNSQRIEAEGLPSESMLWHKLSAGRARSFDTDEQSWSILSFMARVNYSLFDRYMLTLTARQDGSSRFGEGQKVGYFPSVAVAWRISDEPFLRDVSVVSDLKLRSSYGVTDNTAIAPYESLGSLSNSSYIFGSDPALGFEPSTLANPDLRWESSHSGNIGLDFALFNNRLAGSVEYYRIDNRDLLLEQALPSSTGYESMRMGGVLPD